MLPGMLCHHTSYMYNAAKRLNFYLPKTDQLPFGFSTSLSLELPSFQGYIWCVNEAVSVLRVLCLGDTHNVWP